MAVKITVRMSAEDAVRFELAVKEGKLKEFGIESIELPSENRQWADLSLEKRGNLKSDARPKLP